MIIKYIVKSHNDICRQNVVLTGLVTGRLAEAGLEAGLPVGVVPRGGVVLAGEMRGVVALGGGAEVFSLLFVFGILCIVFSYRNPNNFQ